MGTGMIPTLVAMFGTLDEAFAYEALTVADTAKTLTAATYQNATNQAVSALLSLETAEIRYTLDGTVPTTAVGHIMSAGQSMTLVNQHQLANFQAIRTGGTSGALKVTYFRKGAA
jgi:hypothetical protein